MEQAGFSHRKPSAGEVIRLRQIIEDFFSPKKKADVVYVELVVAYDTVWHHDITYKLFHFLPYRDMVQKMMKLSPQSLSLSI